jgi:fluoroacetyl-CoA thioesterase
MTESKIELPLDQVAQRLDTAGIPWAVFAGAAATAYGSPRPLTDVDILVPAADGTRVAVLFPEARLKRREDGFVQALQLPGFDILAGLSTMDLDEQMAARLTRRDIAGVSVPVIPAEDNILLKGLWGRGPEEGKHDWEDVQAMLAHLPAVDWEYLRWRASQCEPGEHVEQVLERIEAVWQKRGWTKETIAPGLMHEGHYIVEETHTARHLGSGGVPVLATPTMILWMEETSRGAVESLLSQGQLTVGSRLDVRHLAPTPVGKQVTVRARLLAVEGRKLKFGVEAHDEQEKVGEGTHERYIIDLDEFSQRVAGKK